ncbi:MAG: S41 family peptidase [Defluviitaleaceae bacterium]|nr:S41 family peptidase [Defluviitaleaceae bacterium]MCL2238510.1 S41 family peptidase [Defluviitaleaceae bacterium]
MKGYVFLGLIFFLLAACGTRTDEDDTIGLYEDNALRNRGAEDYALHIGEHIEEQDEIEAVYEAVIPTLQDALARANERRESIIRLDSADLLQSMEGHAANPADFWDFVNIDMPWGENIPIEDALADVDDFFQLLRNIYAGYTYFGGDEVFLPIHERISAAISAYTNRIHTYFFEQIINRYLSPVVNDAHFFVGRHSMARAYHFHAGIVPFDRTANGFRNRENGLYAVEIDGIPIYDVMRLSIDERGAFFYAIVMPLDTHERILNVTRAVLYSNGTSEYMQLSRYPVARTPMEPPKLEWFDTIPVVSMTTMSFESHVECPQMGITQLEATDIFLSFAEKLQDEPAVILDLRGNGGGSSVTASRWIYTLTGEIVPFNHIQIGIYVDEANPVERTPYCTSTYTTQVNLDRFLPMPFDHFGGLFMMRYLPDEIVERENILIVLADRFTGSSAEFLVDLTTNITNTLIVGTNTRGVANFGGNYVKTMPRSGVPFRFSNRAIFWPEGHLPEGIGIAPDIWVSGDALTAALAMLAQG